MNPIRATHDLGARQAADDIRQYRRDPASLADLPLGRFSEAGVRSLLLRRLLLRLPPLAHAMGFLASVAPGTLRAKFSGLAAETTYWRAARSLLTREEWTSLTRGPVILMYHAVGRQQEQPSRYVIPRDRLERQIRWLKKRRYHLLTLGELAHARMDGLPTGRVVVLTFDDGYRDNAEPLLKSGAPATIFVVTRAAGGTNEWDADGLLRGRRLLGWDELRTLRAAGVEIGGHSRTHPVLPDLPPDGLAAEIRGSLADLRRELGPGDYTFAYPHGRYSGEAKAALATAWVESGDARYAAAAGSRGGVNDPSACQYALRRVEIKGADSFLSFVLMVELGRRITSGQLLRSLLFG